MKTELGRIIDKIIQGDEHSIFFFDLLRFPLFYNLILFAK